MRSTLALLAATALLGFWPAPAAATLVTLSDLSSMESQAPADTLDATLDFQVTGTTLTLTVTNTTNTTNDPGDLWDLADMFFNVSVDVLSLSLTSAPTGWSLAPSDWTGPGDTNSTTQADGMGVFDWALLYDRDNNPPSGQVNPGEIVVFTISITCALSATCDMLDFGTELSVDPGDEDPANLSLAAAKFRGVEGGNFQNMSGFGSVPEPSTALFAGLGLAAALWARRRARP